MGVCMVDGGARYTIEVKSALQIAAFWSKPTWYWWRCNVGWNLPRWPDMVNDWRRNYRNGNYSQIIVLFIRRHGFNNAYQYYYTQCYSAKHCKHFSQSHQIWVIWDEQTTTQKTKDRATQPNYNVGLTLVFRQRNHLLFNMRHPSCYSCYKPGNKSWIRKEPDCLCVGEGM
jgi:hypothetical protein